MMNAKSLSFLSLVLAALSLNSLVIRSSAANTYSSVIVFGDKYSEDGTNRFRDPIKNPRRSNVVEPFPKAWTERLVEVLYSNALTPLFNYAQAGAFADNNVGNPGSARIKDTRSQIAKYTQDLSEKKIAVGPGKLLYFHWVGVEAILDIWSTAAGFNPSGGKDLPSTGGDAPSDQGNKLIDQQIAAVQSQIEQMAKNQAIQMYPSGLVLMTIPPLEGSPRVVAQIKDWSLHNKDSAPLYRGIIQRLVRRYNRGLSAIADSYKAANSTGVDFVKVFDTTPTWNRILDAPSKYGIINVTDSVNVRGDPNKYFYVDSLYPSATVHAVLGDDVAQFVKSIQV